MIPRISTVNPTSMMTSVYFNEKKYVGGGRYRNNNAYQCVNYAMGRTCELAQKPVTYYSGTSTKAEIEKPMFNRSGYGDACNWIKDTLWDVGTKPKLGAVMVYGTTWGGGLGHVRVVEKIEDGKIFYSGANENRQMAFKWISFPKISTTGFLGYIYNPYVVEDEMLIKIKKQDEYEYKWSVDGNKYGTDYSVTGEKGFADTELEAQGWERVLKVNGSLFYKYDNDYFACGLEKSRGVNNQEIEMSAVYDYNSCMAIASVGEDLYFGSQKWIINNKLEEAYGAITGLGLILSGTIRSDLHKGFETQWNQISGRTVIGEDKQGNFLSYSFAGETGKFGMTCAELASKCLELGFENAICLDGGGSVFREYRNDQNQLVYDITTTRKVKNALMLYRRKKLTEDTSNEYKELEQKYLDLKYAYDVLLDTNGQLKDKLDQSIAEKNQAEELLSKAEDSMKTMESKLERIKEICG